MIDVPVSLVERLSRGQAVLVAGLGCSKLVGRPGWEELALRLADSLDDVGRRMQVKELVAMGRCADAVAYLGTRLPRDTTIELLREAYGWRPEVPAVLRRLASVPWRAVISTGYDGLWAAVAAAGTTEDTLFGPEDSTQVTQHRGRFTWQIAGEASAPATLNLGALEGRRTPAGGVSAALRVLAERSSFLFVGYRPGDPDLLRVVRHISDAAGGGPHFLLSSGDPRLFEAELLDADLGLQTVAVEGSLEGALDALQAALATVAAEVRPPDDDIEGWLDVWARDQGAAEARVMLARAEARLREERNWKRLVTLLLGRVERGTDRAERAAVLRGLARLYDGPLEAPERAFTALATAFRLEPEADGLLDDLERAAGKAGSWTELGAAMAEAADNTTDAARATRLRVKAAELQAGRGGDPASAIASYEHVLKEGDAPAAHDALDALERLYRKAERWSDLARVLDQKAAGAADPAVVASLRRERADLLAERLDDAAASVRELEAVLIHAPDDRATLSTLEQLYMQSGREGDALRLLERLAGLADSDAERVLLWRRLAARWEVAATPDALERAAAALDQILKANPRDAEALRALVRVHWQAERWPALIDALLRQVEATESPLGRREQWATLGALYEEKLGDETHASDAYAKAVALGDERETTLAPLARMEEHASHWPAAVEALDKLAVAARTPAARADALVRAALIAEEQLGDRAAARARCERALEIDPGHAGALRSLAAACRADFDLGRAAELLRELEKHTQDPAEQVSLLYERAVMLEDGLANSDEATAVFSRVLEMDPKHMLAAKRLATLHARAGRWDVLVPILDMLARAGEQAGDPDAAVLYARLGEAAERSGDAERAVGAYETARRLAPGLPTALLGLGALRFQRGEWAQAAALYQALIDGHKGTLPPAELIDVQVNLGRCRAELGYNAAAIDAYRAAEALAPDRRDTVHRLLELYSQEKRWSDAAAAWLRLADSADRPVPRAKCLYTAAVMTRDHLGDREQAVALFNRALDHAPGMIKAFDAIERMLTDAAAWQELAQSYRKMIERLPTQGFSELRLRLWSGLGDVSLKHLADLETAATALDVAAFLDPGNLGRREQLAEVYLQAGPDHHEKAIAEHQWLLARNPDRLACYRALAKLYGETGEADKLWCVAAALSFLRRAEPDLQRFYEEHRPRLFCAAKRPFDDDIWSKVAHPDEDPSIGAILSLIGDLVPTAAGAEPTAAALRREDRVDLALDGRLPTRALRYVSGVLRLRPPDLFFSNTDPISIALRDRCEGGVPTPALVIGKGIEQRASENELVFEMGKRVSFLRPGHFVRHALASPKTLDAAIRAALALGGSPINHGVHNGEVGKLTAELRRLVPQALAERVAEAGQKLAASKGETIDVESWITAADLTAARVGFVLTNDLSSAARVISTEPADTSPLPPKQRLKDLLVYSVSESYFAVRKRLGLDILQSDATPNMQVFH